MASFLEGNYVYSVAASCKKRFVGDTYTLDNCYESEFMEFHHLLTGGEQPVDYPEVIAPVYILNAMYRAYLGGKEEPVNPIGEI